ncbi:phage tail tube protein [Desulfuromonas sp. TF]|uniref:phage tail tube protein n=1 Tax=Desulfuromonas sp. TF TaxID=1232410 RepID=UPI00041964C1|nr:phage tail tube protein [Desulfuromonas sp. TF]
MNGISGAEIRAAFVRAVAWGQAVACGAGHGLLILPTSIRKDSGVESDDSLGTYHSSDGDPGAITVEGDLPLYLRYDGLDPLLALVCGIAGAPVQQGADPAYAYKYRPAKDIKGYFGTFAKDMKNYVEEIPSAKLAGFTLRGDAGGKLQLVLKVIGINKITVSGVNTPATFVNVTIPEVANPVRFAHGVFRMNDRDAVALAAGDKIYPSSFEFSYMRKLAGVHTGEYRTAEPNVQELIDEPLNDGAPEVRLKLQFPRHSSNAFLLDLANDKRKKFDAVFTGATIGATAHKRTFSLSLPHLQPLNDDPADERGIIKEPLEYLVHAAEVAPAGFDFTEPFEIGGINQNAADPLA